ncbi:dipeptidase E [Ancylobacter sp. 3268]|uniref:Type 1 glutamine amidotransferase-like domain-containing protein n=1 Tax=Ancylobacter sp. 3268 TaxID=2817752 RepID=UPI002861B04E|nr:Type 1 glutamine amidotransferase-like domain-containing protein [Ancylobacter sp. 3268]MDR6952195.1 dipeptidase E [Ancylobacter sp. 3268]
MIIDAAGARLNLVLYSDQIVPANAAVDTRLLALLTARAAGRRIGYIPSGPEPDRRFYMQRQAHYARLGLDLALFHDPLADAAEREALFACDAIHLSGGNTGGFLRRLRKAGLIDPLRDWALAGGMLIGTSAGALLMTPTIAADSLFSGGRPEDVADGAALGLVPFEFLPHLDADARHLPALLRYSRATPYPIFACRDGDGLVVSGERIACIGASVWVAGGEIVAAGRVTLPGWIIEPA